MTAAPLSGVAISRSRPAANVSATATSTVAWICWLACCVASTPAAIVASRSVGAAAGVDSCSPQASMVNIISPLMIGPLTLSLDSGLMTIIKSYLHQSPLERTSIKVP